MGHKLSKQSLMINIDKDKEISAPLIDPTVTMTPEKKKTTKEQPTTRSVDEMRKTGCIPKTRPVKSNKARKIKISRKLPEAPPSSPSAEQQVTDLIESHDDRNLSFLSTTLTVPRQLIEKDANGVRRFIIKIQLTKMEEPPLMEKVIQVDAGLANEVPENNGNVSTNNATNNNLNVERSYLNLTFTKNIPCDLGTEIDPLITLETINGQEIKLNNLSQRTPGSQEIVTDEFLENFSLEALENGEEDFVKKCNEPIPSTSRGISTSTSSTLSTPATSVINNINITLQQMNTFRVLGTEVTVCTKSGQSKSVNLQNKDPFGDSISDIKVGGKTPLSCGKKSGACASKWTCCKCACRDIIKKFLETTRYTAGPNTKNIWPSKFNCAKRNISDSKTRKRQKDSENASGGEGAKGGAGKENKGKEDLKGKEEDKIRRQRRDGGEPAAPNTAGASNSAPRSQNRNLNRRREMTFWSPRDVLYPIASKYPIGSREPQPQIVVVQCPPSQIITVNQIVDLEDRVRLLRSTERNVQPPLPIEPWHRHAAMHVPSLHNTNSCGIVNGASSGVRAHSQVDYIHCLVPDLEQITSSSFYWGKMDRYEAERLLEGKAEGTFLLRDSAQEEYLFSVTFRKYGRSLHARIEQFNHKFSFDCHDPGVFTASTVTALLEHYKDPSCVMFFEPMLTIPLNRNFSFSLQQLARAAMVSNISYDGIKGLELPKSLKSYLKDYHYKLRVRVKPFDEPMYTCS